MDTDTRNWSMLAHFSAVLAQFFLPSFGFVGPLAVMLLRQNDEVTQYHAKQALFFQIAMGVTAWLIVAVASALSCFLIGVVIYPFALIPWIAGWALPVYAGIKVNNGESYTYPMVGGFVDPPKRIG
jgi:uncharacterized Tic20 family protein